MFAGNTRYFSVLRKDDYLRIVYCIISIAFDIASSYPAQPQALLRYACGLSIVRHLLSPVSARSDALLCGPMTRTTRMLVVFNHERMSHDFSRPVSLYKRG